MTTLTNIFKVLLTVIFALQIDLTQPFQIRPDMIHRGCKGRDIKTIFIGDATNFDFLILYICFRMSHPPLQHLGASPTSIIFMDIMHEISEYCTFYL
jgi:hypothetical protein